MAVKLFDCENCGAHGKITWKETDEYSKGDIVYCPFCSADIYEDEQFTDEEEE